MDAAVVVYRMLLWIRHVWELRLIKKKNVWEFRLDSFHDLLGTELCFSFCSFTFWPNYALITLPSKYVVSVVQQGAVGPKSISTNCQRKHSRLENCIEAQAMSSNCVSFCLEISTIHVQAYQIRDLYQSLNRFSWLYQLLSRDTYCILQEIFVLNI